jgi:hypothetical protein
MTAGPRDRTIYVSKQTLTRLFWIRQIEMEGKAGKTTNSQTEANKIPTLDEIADRMLNERIEEVYPNIKTLEKRLNTLEDQLVSELLSPTVEK